jgi:hypothetical protein
VELVESTGTDSYVHLSAPAGRLVWKLGQGPPPSLGERMTVVARAADVHVFDAKSEGRLG